MKNSVGWLSAIFAVFLMCLFAGVGLYAYRQRLGLSLSAPTPIALVTNTPRAEIAAVEATPTIEEVEVVEVPTATEMPVEATVEPSGCGETGAWNILVLGSDLNDIGAKRGSDLTRILRADFDNNQVVVYAFPRDLWVDTSSLGWTNPTLTSTRLGNVFQEGRLRSPQFGIPEVMTDGVRASASMMQRNFTIQSDHYMALDLNQLPAIVDAVGGIPINIPMTTTDPWIGMVIPAGEQTLNGSQVAAYSRAIPDSDFGRIARNEILLEAIRQKLLQPEVWAMIPELYTRYSAVIITDFSLEQIQHLACLMRNVPSDRLTQESVKMEWTHPGPDGSLTWDQPELYARLKELGIIQ